MPRLTQFGEKLLNFVWNTPIGVSLKKISVTGEDSLFGFEFQK
jgi:hypothetical protein